MARKRFCGSQGGWCPICGVIKRNDERDHRCASKTLAAIDAAHRRDLDEEEPRNYRSFAARLADGFMMLDDEREDYGEYDAWNFTS